MSDAFDLTTTYVHLGLGARAELLPDFQWTREYLDAYRDRTADDGDEGRLVSYHEQRESWDTWERHPAGEELVLLVAGRADLFQEIDGEVLEVELTPGMAIVNPPGVWHTVDIHEPGHALFITPGRGTEVRPR